MVPLNNNHYDYYYPPFHTVNEILWDMCEWEERSSDITPLFAEWL